MCRVLHVIVHAVPLLCKRLTCRLKLKTGSNTRLTHWPMTRPKSLTRFRLWCVPPKQVSCVFFMPHLSTSKAKFQWATKKKSKRALHSATSAQSDRATHCQLTSCQLLHNCTKSHILKGFIRCTTLKFTQGHRNCYYSSRQIWFPIGDL